MYSELVAALKATDIPFEEIAWENAPQVGPYGVISLDGQGAALWADDRMTEQALQGTIDLYVRDRGLPEMLTVQNVLAAQGVAWALNSIQFESERQLMHFEWIFEVEVL